MNNSSPSDRKQLRQAMRRRRRALSKNQQRSAAIQLYRRLVRQPIFLRSHHIAFYFANDGEISPEHLLHAALRRGKKCYIPVLEKFRGKRLKFARYDRDTRLHNNRFGISEPTITHAKSHAARNLDLVLLPLVAFDRQGGRLGMGGGFYDRSFAFKQNQTAHTPYLLGLAHHCQEVERLSLAHWDIPLRAVITDHNVFVCQPKGAERDFSKRDISIKWDSLS